jgi:hypothetical protein
MTNKPKSTAKTKGRKPSYRGPRSLGQTVRKISRKSFEKQGFAVQEIVGDWRLIVGETLADVSVPVRISKPRGENAPGAVMQVRVDQAGALDFQHIAPIVIDRINTYYGYRAIDRIAIVQGPVTRPEIVPEKPNRPLTATEEAKLDELLADIDNDALRKALSALGRSILTEDDADT